MTILSSAQRSTLAGGVAQKQRQTYDQLLMGANSLRAVLGIADLSTSTVAVPRNLIAHIGDSLSSDDQYMNGNAELFITNKYKSIGGFRNAEWYGRFGKFINVPAPYNDPYTTVQNIRNFRADVTKGEPDVWVIALGTNMQTDTAHQQAGDYSPDTTAMDQVLAELGPSAYVAVVGVATSGNRGSVPEKAINDAWRQRMVARGAHGHFCDYAAHLASLPNMDWNYPGAYFQDYTHLTSAGYEDKWTWAPNDITAWLDSIGQTTPGGSTTTTETGTTGTTATAATSQYAASVAALGPVCYLPMQDEFVPAAQGTGAVQIKGSDGTLFYPHGTYYPDDTRVYDKGPAATGKIATTYIKNGVNDSGVSLAPKLSVLSTMVKSNRWSATMWINASAATYKQTLLAFQSASDHLSLHIANDGGGIRMENSAAEVLGSAATLVGRWVMAGVTFDQGTVTLYLNGAQVGQGTLANWTADLTSAWALSFLGTGANANCYTGSVKQLAVVGKAMTAAEHSALYNTGTQAIYEVPWYGKSANYGGNAAFFTNPREAELAKATTPFSGNWQATFPTGDSTQIAAESRSYKLAIHANPWNLLSDWQPTKQLALPDYESMVQAVADREYQTAQANGMYWVSQPMRQFSDKTTTANVPGWVESDEWDMGSLQPTETSTWADKAAKMDYDLNTYLPSATRAYINQGTGVTVGTNDRFQERKFFKNPKLMMTGADFYVQCINKKVAQDAADGGYPSNDPAIIRRPIFYKWIQERVRGAFSFNMPVIAAVGIGHANQPGVYGDWASVPTPNEVEADCVAAFIGGATGIMWFPQTFEHDFDKQTPAWSATASYKYGDQVRADVATEKDSSGNVLTTYWSCIAPSAAGIDPRTDTPNVRWVRWRVTQRSLASDSVGHAIGMPAAVQRVHSMMTSKAAVLQANNRRNVNANSKLEALLVENVGGTSHMLVMQKWDQLSGSYTVKLPDTAVGKTVTVAHQTGTDNTTALTASATDATVSLTFTSPASYFWLTWPA